MLNGTAVQPTSIGREKPARWAGFFVSGLQRVGSGQSMAPDYPNG